MGALSRYWGLVGKSVTPTGRRNRSLLFTTLNNQQVGILPEEERRIKIYWPKAYITWQFAQSNPFFLGLPLKCFAANLALSPQLLQCSLPSVQIKHLSWFLRSTQHLSHGHNPSPSSWPVHAPILRNVYNIKCVQLSEVARGFNKYQITGA